MREFWGACIEVLRACAAAVEAHAAEVAAQAEAWGEREWTKGYAEGFQDAEEWRRLEEDA